jgi:hypothetical protein
MYTKKRYIWDLVLILSLLAVCAIVFLLFYSKSDTGVYARVYLGDDLIAEYSLAADGEYKIGETNILKIEDGKAYMIYANCPDGWCKNQGKISFVGERIVCLPNRVMIMIEEGG